jgi:hypothetical protein
MTPTALALALGMMTVPAQPAVKEVKPSQANLRAAVDKALPVLAKGVEGHSAKRTCFTCHNHGVPLLATATARGRGFAVDDKLLATETQLLTDHFEGMRERLADGRGPGPAPVGGGADNTAYALFTFEAVGVEPNKTTAVVADYTLDFDKRRDHWFTPAGRAPTEASDFTTTALAVRGIKRYASDGKKEQASKRVEAARGWLLKAKPKDTEDRAFRLIGLTAAGATEGDIAAASRDLVATQRADGGWAQTDTRTSDAYATGTALYALHAAGVDPTDPPFVRGLAFLLGTQLPDGTWHVRTRSRPIQRYFESGFPHEKDQFISCAATGWATTVLALACDTK